jgi:hypothetical protein
MLVASSDLDSVALGLDRGMIMQIVERAPYSAVRSFDGWIVIGYAAFALIALSAFYFASGGPSVTGADLAIAMALP